MIQTGLPALPGARNSVNVSTALYGGSITSYLGHRTFSSSNNTLNNAVMYGISVAIGAVKYLKPAYTAYGALKTFLATRSEEQNNATNLNNFLTAGVVQDFGMNAVIVSNANNGAIIQQVILPSHRTQRELNYQNERLRRERVDLNYYGLDAGGINIIDFIDHQETVVEVWQNHLVRN